MLWFLCGHVTMLAMRRWMAKRSQKRIRMLLYRSMSMSYVSLKRNGNFCPLESKTPSPPPRCSISEVPRVQSSSVRTSRVQSEPVRVRNASSGKICSLMSYMRWSLIPSTEFFLPTSHGTSKIFIWKSIFEFFQLCSVDWEFMWTL